MTRENKLALVVGFGLILLVGILVSDHFSAARRTRPANLSAPLVDPLVRAGYDDPALIELPAPERPARSNDLLMSPGDRAQNEPAAARGGAPVQRVVMGASHRPAGPVVPATERPAARTNTIGPPPQDAERLAFTYHTVRPGETLSSIAKLHYGDTSLLEELVRYNGIGDPDTVRSGDRLRIPNAGDLVRGRGGPASSTPTPQTTPNVPTTTTYIVKPGDSLSEIASEMLGSARRWREIYEMNRDVIRNPDRVAAGTRLKIARAR
ncbi:MAG: LysM peptidoglycan-binding domain-containing protein [Planctomycetota bacterium]|jgi:nucleoid-associated protein YgaU